MINLKKKKIAVTGASSMIGRAVVKGLKDRGAIVVPVIHKDCDLRNYNGVESLFFRINVDYCVHLAGYNGNILFNRSYPADIFYNTTLMGLNIIRACATTGVKKVVTPLASCAYRSTDDALVETDFDEGMPDASVEAHGLSKKAVYHYSRQANKQHGLQAVCTVFNTAYGPHDSYDVDKTKVVGGLIKKFTEAAHSGDKTVECWGTGSPRRELIYCYDAAEGIIQALEKYTDVNLPINIGFEEDISIRELAMLIAELTGFEGEIVWNTDKPDGQYRKLLDSSRMKDYGIEIKNRTPLRAGLEKTIRWHKDNLR
tara:strand:- start:1395 stop:2333 length:939 start_codon:yes stop_codon:yes gene_type:complete